MLIISLASWKHLYRAQALKSYMKQSSCAVEPDDVSHMTLIGCNMSYFAYELSPSPNVVKCNPSRHVGERFFFSRLVHNLLEFFGNSPCPVVEVTRTSKDALRKTSALSVGIFFYHYDKRAFWVDV